MKYLTKHIRECKDCYLANALKGIEYDVARAMGPTAEMYYIRGQDIRKLPGFDEHFKRIFGAACEQHSVFKTAAAKAWILEQGKRGDYVEDQGESSSDINTRRDL